MADSGSKFWATTGLPRDLIDLSPDLFAVYDSDDRLCFANPAYRAAYHCDPAEHRSWRDIMRSNHEARRGAVIQTEKIEAWLMTALARRGTVPHRGFEAELHDGRWIWITETVCPNGRMLFHASDVTSLRSESRILRDERDAARRASWTDPLTGMPNRRYLMERLEGWLQAQRALPDFGAHSIAVLDLDHFKQLNDFYGHAIGDAVLVSFCHRVVEHIRTIDLFGRIGGEEFLLFLPNCPVDAALTRLEALQAVIAEGPTHALQTGITYTFSAGVAGFAPGEDLHETIRRADRLLFRAKTEGRARVRG
jgi:diguanylate cyclase (GGDEF)-like protein